MLCTDHLENRVRIVRKCMSWTYYAQSGFAKTAAEFCSWRGYWSLFSDEKSVSDANYAVAGVSSISPTAAAQESRVRAHPVPTRQACGLARSASIGQDREGWPDWELRGPARTGSL
jgi:hypothetical protein